MSEGNTGWVGWENSCVVGLARDPALHKCNVLVGRDLNRLLTGVQPCERVIAIDISGKLEIFVMYLTYAPADIFGQVLALQIVVPSSSLS